MDRWRNIRTINNFYCITAIHRLRIFCALSRCWTEHERSSTRRQWETQWNVIRDTDAIYSMAKSVLLNTKILNAQTDVGRFCAPAWQPPQRTFYLMIEITAQVTASISNIYLIQIVLYVIIKSVNKDNLFIPECAVSSHRIPTLNIYVWSNIETLETTPQPSGQTRVWWATWCQPLSVCGSYLLCHIHNADVHRSRDNNKTQESLRTQMFLLYMCVRAGDYLSSY